MAGPLPPPSSFAIQGPLAREDLPALYDRFCSFVSEHAPERVLCDVTGVEPSAVTVDALARMQLAARRNGCTVTLCHASERLLALVALMGLADVLPG
ncbi:STAS domain-containing protein [Conexibacter stalactiti]|uniref:STAS domain-containing protein n=1 Tax=Conexibacter stalactiti TaxID=1940611 RepID=A0ABU4HZM5_9ACTN|nr:STAS domain-containing protein [Conexibacter stalactiti]MDW5598750.1 STAS domain-containing protein [Conexibacter stalactiti]MEC5039392.1 STAS domain-containing protein [Conexibacter stalactiti]